MSAHPTPFPYSEPYRGAIIRLDHTAAGELQAVVTWQAGGETFSVTGDDLLMQCREEVDRVNAALLPARPSSTERRRLPNRRNIEVVDIAFRGRAYALSFGRFADGTICEVFVDPAKVASDAAEDSRDVGITISISLQHRVPLATLQSAVSRIEQGRPSSLTGLVLDVLVAEQRLARGADDLSAGLAT